MPTTITLTLAKQDYDYLIRHIGNDATASAIFIAALGGTSDYLSDGDSPLGMLPTKAEPVKKEEPWELLDGWMSFEHTYFYRQAIRQANRILREAARGEESDG